MKLIRALNSKKIRSAGNICCCKVLGFDIDDGEHECPALFKQWQRSLSKKYQTFENFLKEKELIYD